MTPHYIEWTIVSLFYQTRKNNPLVHKGLTELFDKIKRQTIEKWPFNCLSLSREQCLVGVY